MRSDRLYKEIVHRLQMTEGRRSQVVLLDERRLEILIQPKLLAGELLDIVASHFNLKEKEYFGLAFLDDTGHYNWLQWDQRVLEHDFPKKSSSAPLILYFLVKFFVEGISQLRHSVTVEQFYFQAKSLIFKGQLEVEGEVAFELAANALQAMHGDYVDDSSAKCNLKKLPLLPASFFKDQPSIASCEDKVIVHYKKLSGQSRGFAIVNFMSLIEGLPTYGIHYYEVKDKSGTAWWLGLSHKGISQYEYSSKKVPKKVFQWKHLENLYFRDRKFSIEVHDPKRVTHALSSFNIYEDAIEEPLDNFDELSDAITDPTTQVSVSRRTFAPGNVTVLVWFAANPILTKSIWSMAISQHQFYLDKKQAKGSTSSIRRLSEIATELSISRQSLSTGSSASNLSRSGSSQSLNTNFINGQISDDSQQSEVTKAARKEMLAALKARKDALEEKLREKTDELKILCVKEAEIIGELPPEIPLAPGEPRPQIRRRVGTAFTLPENLINKLKSKEDEDLPALELEYEIQSKIASAALKLASDVTAKKSVRKQHKLNYQQSQVKLKLIEQKLVHAKHKLSQRNHTHGQIKKKQPRPSVSSSSGDNVRNRSLEEDSVFFGEAVNLSGIGSPTITPGTPSSGKSAKFRDDTELPEQPTVQSPMRQRHPVDVSHSSASSTCTSLSQSASSTPSSPSRPPPTPCSGSASPNRVLTGGYIPSSIYQRSSYRNQHYPTLSTRTQRCQSEYDNISNGSSTSSGTFNPAYKSKYDATLPMESRGLYNVPMQRASQAFHSQEELDELRDIQRVGSNTDGSYRRHHTISHPQQRYGSLDRAFVSNPHSPRIDSRSLDNLDCSEGSNTHTNVGSPDNLDGPFSSPVIGSDEFPVSPPSPYDLPYRAEDVLNSSPSCLIQNPSSVGDNSSLYQETFHLPDQVMTVGGRYDSCCERLSPHHNMQSHQELLRANFSSSHLPQYSHEQGSPVRTLLVPEAIRPIPNQLTHQTVPYVYLNSYPQQHLNVPHSSISPRSPVSSEQKLSAPFLETSPKAKEKEWYETCLDSPLTPRRISGSSDKSAKNSSSLSSPSSPQKLLKNVLPAGTNAMESSHIRFSPSPTGEPYLSVPFESPHNCTVVSLGQFQPYREETKPYELSDYYKYSTKVRKQQQQQLENQCKVMNSLSNLTHIGNTLGGSSASYNSLRCSPSQRPSQLLLGPDHPTQRGSQFHDSKVSPILQRSAISVSQHGKESPKFQVRSSNHMTALQKPITPISPGCIGPDEAYNPHVGMAFMPQPQQLQGIYQPPRPMTCEPLKRSPRGTPISSPTTVRSNSQVKSRDNSFTLDPGNSLADAFHEEMLAWYEDQETAKQATLV